VQNAGDLGYAEPRVVNGETGQAAERWLFPLQDAARYGRNIGCRSVSILQRSIVFNLEVLKTPCFAGRSAAGILFDKDKIVGVNFFQEQIPRARNARGMERPTDGALRAIRLNGQLQRR
jgi:hypothetical protein